jgi:plasmid stabilization system protein ParE
MKIRQLAEAGRDLEEALDYYAEVNPTLCTALLFEVEQALRRIVEFPEAWRSLGSGLRSHAIGRFPYAVIYRQEPGHVLVVAYAHYRRSPRFWRTRLQDSKDINPYRDVA